MYNKLNKVLNIIDFIDWRLQELIDEAIKCKRNVNELIKEDIFKFINNIKVNINPYISITNEGNFYLRFDGNKIGYIYEEIGLTFLGNNKIEYSIYNLNYDLSDQSNIKSISEINIKEQICNIEEIEKIIINCNLIKLLKKEKNDNDNEKENKTKLD